MAKEAKPSTSAEVQAELEKLYGKGTVQSMDSKSKIEKIDSISTGSIRLDRATGIGGIPVGRIVELVAPESAGKTTIATHILKESQKKDGRKVLIIDAEHTFDFLYAERIGLNRDLVTFCQPDYGEVSFDVMKKLIKTGEYGACVLDSVAENIPKEQHEGETGQSRMARLAALMSMELPKLVPIIDRANCALIFLNQFRSNIGGYGNPERPAGGDSLKYYCSMRFDIRKTAEKDNGRNETRVKVIKNKCAPPWGEATFHIGWGRGILRNMEILEDAIDLDIVKVGGSWYTVDENTKFQGEEKMLQFLDDHPDLVTTYEQLIAVKMAAKEAGL